MKKMTLAMMALAMMCASPAFANHADKAKMMAEQCMDKMDSNHDGMVSKAEHDAAGNDMFMKADTDKNGSLSKEEIVAMKKMEMNDMKDKMEKMKH